jgi:decaprenyl-phosphate phosphoribosyltransferase
LAVLRYAVDVDKGEAEAPEEVVLRDVQLLVLGVIWLVLFALGALGV